MPRVNPIWTAEQFPDNFGAENESAYAVFTEEMARYAGTAYATRGLSGVWACLAVSPETATALMRMSDQLLHRMKWSQDPRLREIVIHAVCNKLGNAHMSMAHWDSALRAGVTPVKLWAVQFVGTKTEAAKQMLDQEEAFVVEFAHAVVSGELTDERAEVAKEMYGEQGFIELTVLVSIYRFWCSVADALDPVPSFVINGEVVGLSHADK